MKLITALEIGSECGLETVGESIFNIKLHAMNLFDYSKMTEELNELVKERNELFANTNFTNESKTKHVLEWMNMEDDGIDTSDLPL